MKRQFLNLLFSMSLILLAACAPLSKDADQIDVVSATPVAHAVKSGGVSGLDGAYLAGGERVSLQKVLSQAPWPFLLPQEEMLPSDVRLDWVEMIESRGTSLAEWTVALHYTGNVLLVVRYPDIPYAVFVAAQKKADSVTLLADLSPLLQNAATQEQALLEENLRRAPQINRKERIGPYEVYIGIPGQAVEFPSTEHKGITETELMIVPQAVVNWVHTTGLYSIIDWPEYGHLKEDPTPQLLQVTKALIAVANP